VLLAAVALGVSPTERAGASTRLNREACILVGASGAPGLNDLSNQDDVGAYGCEVSECREQVTDPETGEYLCHYGRAALVGLSCQRSSRRAHAFVDRLVRDHGYERLKLGVDAAISAKQDHVSVAMALGRETAEYIPNVFSDDDPNPIWDGIRADAIKGAKNLIPVWKHRQGKIC